MQKHAQSPLTIASTTEGTTTVALGADGKSFIFQPETIKMLTNALELHIELLSSPTSADRDANPEQADLEVQLAKQLLVQLPNIVLEQRLAIANLQAIRQYDCVLDDVANGGDGARPPEGDDYNAIFQLAETALGHLA